MDNQTFRDQSTELTLGTSERRRIDRTYRELWTRITADTPRKTSLTYDIRRGRLAPWAKFLGALHAEFLNGTSLVGLLRFVDALRSEVASWGGTPHLCIRSARQLEIEAEAKAAMPQFLAEHEMSDADLEAAIEKTHLELHATAVLLEAYESEKRARETSRERRRA